MTNGAIASVVALKWRRSAAVPAAATFEYKRELEVYENTGYLGACCGWDSRAPDSHF